MNLPFHLNAIDWQELTDYIHVTMDGLVLLLCTLIPTILFVVNVLLFRRPGREWNKRLLPPVSVLIPARDEEQSIGAAVESVLASRGVDLEVIVLDDGSTDRTAEIVAAIAEKDPRVRIEAAPALPENWNGKQHACWMLATLATHDVFCYLDADVRVGPEAIYRMASELNYIEGKEDEKAMVSGFPRQETGTLLEKLLLPLINFILLGFLPLIGERYSRRSGFAAGCGQFMMVRREPYYATGGHSAISLTMHDGLLLPILFRRYRFRTSVYDLSNDAVCRMYRSAGQVWRGLAKNATEGMATFFRLPVFTLLLLVGQVLPVPFLIWTVKLQYLVPFRFAFFAVFLSYSVRFFSAWKYKQSWLGAFLHPLGVLILLVLQWFAFFRKLFRIRATWKDRAYRVR
jgi:glycosyltransferase involved in cell wall biosynthesis